MGKVATGDAQKLRAAQVERMKYQGTFQPMSNPGMQTDVTYTPNAKTVDGLELGRMQMKFTVTGKSPQERQAAHVIEAVDFGFEPLVQRENLALQRDGRQQRRIGNRQVRPVGGVPLRLPDVPAGAAHDFTVGSDPPPAVGGAVRRVRASPLARLKRKGMG